MIRARVIGAGGYGGLGIVDLLLRHPGAEVVDVIARENVGQPLSTRHPHLRGHCDLPIVDPEAIDWSMPVDVVFSATPDRVGMGYARRALEAGAKFIDYSGDYRFDSVEAYAAYAARIGKPTEHDTPELLPETVYGLAELHRGRIAASRLVGNPGCFAVSAILGFAPAMAAGAFAPDSLICDAKTGISGAGIKPHPSYHYPSRYENMNAYKIAAHQHCVEVERELGLLAGAETPLTLTTQVVPLARGIMSCCYGQLTDAAMDAEALTALYRDFYRESPFVRVNGPGEPASNNDVRGSNYCVVWVNVDARTRRGIVVSHIDNLVKGQAGSALQNMNLLCGLPETTGMDHPAFYP